MLTSVSDAVDEASTLGAGRCSTVSLEGEFKLGGT